MVGRRGKKRLYFIRYIQINLFHGWGGPFRPIYRRQQPGAGDEYELRRLRVEFGNRGEFLLQQSLAAGRCPGHYVFRIIGRRRRCRLQLRQRYDGIGQAVNGLASTLYNVAVGGTKFNEGSGNYWNTSNGSGYVSAISYIPEAAWNESGSFQAVPDCGLRAEAFRPYTPSPRGKRHPEFPQGTTVTFPMLRSVQPSTTHISSRRREACTAVGGTSAASPAFAGLMALVVQKTGQRQGNANVRFYQIGNAQYGSGGPAIFHEVSSGNNSVPGVNGYCCSTGYDAVTGLGSVDANALVNEMNLRSTPFTLAVTTSGSGSGTVTSSPSGINCGSACSASFNGRTVVTLAATPGGGSAFTGWSGACSGTQPTCQVNITGAMNVTAGFAAVSPPGSPTGVTATQGDHQVTVSFTAPASNGGSPVTSYTVTAYFASGTVVATATGPAGPITVTGLTDGITYYFTVTATNAAGTGAASAPSNNVTPNPPVAVPALGSWGFLATALLAACFLRFRKAWPHRCRG